SKTRAPLPRRIPEFDRPELFTRASRAKHCNLPLTRDDVRYGSRAYARPACGRERSRCASATRCCAPHMRTPGQAPKPVRMQQRRPENATSLAVPLSDTAIGRARRQAGFVKIGPLVAPKLHHAHARECASPHVATCLPKNPGCAARPVGCIVVHRMTATFGTFAFTFRSWRSWRRGGADSRTSVI